MDTKTISLRISTELYNTLTQKGEKKLNPVIIELAEKAMLEERIKKMDIRGIFSEDEWKALASSLNGTIVTDAFRYSIDAFIAHCEDAEKYEAHFSNFNVKVNDFIQNKARHLTRLQIASIYERCEDFWNNAQKIDLGDWAKY